MDFKEARWRIEDHMLVHHMKEHPRCEKITEALQLALAVITSYEQVKWERDIAIEQLADLGLSFGQKIDGIYLPMERYRELRELELGLRPIDRTDK